MSDYTKVGVMLDTDDLGQTVPTRVVWTNGREYLIRRILHVYHPDDKVITYTILIGNSQRSLHFNGEEWRISFP